MSLSDPKGKILTTLKKGLAAKFSSFSDSLQNGLGEGRKVRCYVRPTHVANRGSCIRQGTGEELPPLSPHLSLLLFLLRGLEMGEVPKRIVVGECFSNALAQHFSNCGSGPTWWVMTRFLVGPAEPPMKRRVMERSDK